MAPLAVSASWRSSSRPLAGPRWWPRPARHSTAFSASSAPCSWRLATAWLRGSAPPRPAGSTPRWTWSAPMRRSTFSLALVADQARIATIVAVRRSLAAGIKVLGGAPGAEPGTKIRNDARLELARLAQEGKLHVFVTQTFQLADAVAAHRASMSSDTTE